MALTAEEKKEVQHIIEDSFKGKDIDIAILQQQWKKFKDVPEARLAALEVKVDDLTYEFREFKKEMRDELERINQKFEGINQKFEGMNRKFEGMNKTIIDMHKSLNSQVWKFIGGLGFILILLKLAGALFP